LKVEAPESQKRVQWSVRLPQDLIDRIEALAEFEGKPIQEITERIFRMFFSAIGPLPEKKSFLDGDWPGPSPIPRKP
jgi:hypothetical protein